MKPWVQSPAPHKLSVVHVCGPDPQGVEAGGFSDRNNESETSLGYRNLNLQIKISKYIKRKEKRLSLPAAEVCLCLLAIAGVNAIGDKELVFSAASLNT